MSIFGKKEYTVVSTLDRTKDVKAFVSSIGVEDKDIDVHVSGTLYENEPFVRITFKTKEPKETVFERFCNELKGKAHARRRTLFLLS